MLANLPNDRLRANQLDLVVGNLESSVTVSAGNNVTKIANVALFILGSTVGLAEGVEVSTSRSAPF